MDRYEALKKFHTAIFDNENPGSVLRGLSLEDVLRAHHEAGHLHFTAIFALNVTGHMDAAIYSNTLPGPTFEYEVQNNDLAAVPPETTAGYARQAYRNIFLSETCLEGFVRKHHLLDRNDFSLVLGADQEVAGAVCATLSYQDREEILASIIVRGNLVDIEPVDAAAAAT